ncbi:hypothetical protein Lac2_14510 [Claveliimonas bilis]|nr:hypothetical protein Lac2_14510 [Claveliimonas bilis]
MDWDCKIISKYKRHDSWESCFLLCNENRVARRHQDILSEQETGRIFFQIDKQKVLWYTICD